MVAGETTQPTKFTCNVFGRSAMLQPQQRALRALYLVLLGLVVWKLFEGLFL